MKSIVRLVFFIPLLLVLTCGIALPDDSELFCWENLPVLPEPLGVGGPFAGVTSDVLVIAGGAYFPVSLFEGGSKVWTDKIQVLERNGESFSWHSDFTLDRPLAYGASVTTERGIICIGGCDSERCYADVFSLEWIDGQIKKTSLPSLPKPCAFTSAVTIGNILYVAGGQDTMTPDTALNNFWALNLSHFPLEWETLASWPGPGRILPVAATQNNAFYLFSGCELVRNPDGITGRRYLTDSYRFNPDEKSWTRIADIPVAVAGAPTPGYPCSQSHILIFGGDNGEYADRTMELKDRHPGFSRDILAYHTITDTWTKAGTLNKGQVTTTTVIWDDTVVIPSGEIQPGIRTPEIYRGKPGVHTSELNVTDYITLSVYLCMLVLMGVYFAKHEKGTEDFFLAGHRIPWWAAGLSIFGTQLSAITFMAIPAKSFASNWQYFLMNMGIVAVAPFIIWFFLPFYRRLNVTSAYEYLEKRFNIAVRLIGSSLFIILQVGRMGMILYLPAIALSAVTGINVYLCIAVMGILCTIYTVLGGIEAVIWTDVLQVIVLFGGALLSMVILILHTDGGVTEIIRTGIDHGKFAAFDWRFDFESPVVWVILLGWMNVFVPYASDQTVIQRYLTTKNEKEAARGIWTNALLCIPATLLFFGVGTALFVFYKSRPELLNPSIPTDTIFPWFIAQEIPSGIAGLVIAGIFAAAMSSLDSSLNSVATVAVTDFYRRFRQNITDHAALNFARCLTVFLGIIGTGTAIIIASMNIASLWDLFIRVLGLFGGGLAGLFVLGIFTRRAHATGAIIGICSSSVVQYLFQSQTHFHFFLYSANGFFTCIIVGYLASLFIHSKQSDIIGLTIYTVK